MRRVALGNDAMRSDTMITNDKDLQLIVLSVENLSNVNIFSTSITITTTDIKIWWYLIKLLRQLYD